MGRIKVLSCGVRISIGGRRGIAPFVAVALATNSTANASGTSESIQNAGALGARLELHPAQCS